MNQLMNIILVGNIVLFIVLMSMPKSVSVSTGIDVEFTRAANENYERCLKDAGNLNQQMHCKYVLEVNKTIFKIAKMRSK